MASGDGERASGHFSPLEKRVSLRLRPAGANMEIPIPSLENIKAVWGWTLQRLQLWFQVLRDPAGVLERIDLNSTDETITAIQFAVFPITLGTVLMIPPFLVSMTKDTTFGIVSFLIVNLIVSGLSVFIYAVAQRLGAKLVSGKGSLNACTISTLYGTAFWPLSAIIVYTATNHRDFYNTLSPDVLPSRSEVLLVLTDLMILAVVVAYLLYKFLAMTKVVHKVGLLRALFICLVTAIVAFAVVNATMSSLSKAMMGM
jgi:hypothetical protein